MINFRLQLKSLDDITTFKCNKEFEISLTHIMKWIIVTKKYLKTLRHKICRVTAFYIIQKYLYIVNILNICDKSVVFSKSRENFEEIYNHITTTNSKLKISELEKISDFEPYNNRFKIVHYWTLNLPNHTKNRTSHKSLIFEHYSSIRHPLKIVHIISQKQVFEHHPTLLASIWIGASTLFVPDAATASVKRSSVSDGSGIRNPGFW